MSFEFFESFLKKLSRASGHTEAFEKSLDGFKQLFFEQHVCKIFGKLTKKLPKSSEVCNGEIDAINF